MIDEYLSTGFTDVDSAQNQDAYFSCLALMDSLAYFREYKLKSYERLEPKHGMKGSFLAGFTAYTVVGGKMSINAMP